MHPRVTGASHGDNDGFREHGGPLSGDSGEIDFRKHMHSFRWHRLGRRSQDGVMEERVLRAEMFVLALRRWLGCPQQVTGFEHPLW